MRVPTKVEEPERDARSRLQQSIADQRGIMSDGDVAEAGGADCARADHHVARREVNDAGEALLPFDGRAVRVHLTRRTSVIAKTDAIGYVFLEFHTNEGGLHGISTLADRASLHVQTLGRTAAGATRPVAF